MSGRKPQHKKPESTHCHLCIRLNAYEASATARVHHHAYSPEYAWRYEGEELLFEYANKVLLTASAYNRALDLGPSSRAR